MDWLTDDPEMLDAALFLLAGDSTNGDEGVVLQSAAVPCEDTPGQAKRQRTNSGSAAKAINISRERQRKELATLRQQSGELEAKLSALQIRREQQLRPFLTASGEATSIAVYWEAIAKRQFQERKRSEMLNAKLRAMRETQLRVADDLVAVIRRAEEQSKRINAQGMILGESKPRVRLPIDISQKVSEEDQLQRLELLCTQLEEVFSRSPKLSDPSCLQFLDMHSREDGSGDIIVDVYGSSAFPYPAKLVSEVLWKFQMAKSGEVDGDTFAQDYKTTSDNKFIGIFESSATVQGVRATFNGKFVDKKIVDDKGRLTIVSHSFCVAQQVGRPEKAEMNDDTWTRVVDAADIGVQHLGSQLTVVQHVARSRVSFSGLAVTMDSDFGWQEDRRHALIDFLKLQSREGTARSEQELENMLLDAAKAEASRSE